MLEAKVEAKPEAPTAGTTPLPSDSDMARFSPQATPDPSLKSDGSSFTFGSIYANLSADANTAKTSLGSLITSGENADGSINNELSNGLARVERVSAPYLGRVENALFNKPGNLPSVAEVEVPIAPTPSGATHSDGTGFFVTPDSLVTADHVVSGAQGPIDIKLTDGQTVQAQVSKTDAADDLALLTVTGTNAQFPTLSVASDADITPSDTLYGNPYGLPQTEFSGSYASKVPYSALNQSASMQAENTGRNANATVDIFNIAGHPGASGGPILNSQGAVVSVAEAGGFEQAIGIPAQAIQNLMS